MLLKLVSRMDRRAFTNEVVSLTNAGAVAASLESAGVRARAVGMRSGAAAALRTGSLWQWIRAYRPDVVQTWLYHADLIGGVAAKLAGCRQVFWNIRHSRLDPEVDKRTTIGVARWCGRLSRILPARVVCCSEAARREHVAIGYAAEKMEVIPNGFEVERFRPDAEARRVVRSELGITDAEMVVALVARFHPVKDHGGLIAAAERVLRAYPAARFVLCGEGIEWSNQEIAGAIDRGGLRSAFRLLGKRNDIARIFGAADVAVSSSISEGFPNTVGEAMACGVPCVVTDVGESAAIVGDTGRVVPPRDPQAMADALLRLAAEGRALRVQLGRAARARVESNFTIAAVVRRYEDLYRRAVTGCSLEQSSPAVCAET
jgi:glycosyltransferase involved in cell wall biosynthesis